LGCQIDESPQAGVLEGEIPPPGKVSLGVSDR
jgi:hypothetical protein